MRRESQKRMKPSDSNAKLRANNSNSRLRASNSKSGLRDSQAYTPDGFQMTKAIRDNMEALNNLETRG